MAGITVAQSRKQQDRLAALDYQIISPALSIAYACTSIHNDDVRQIGAFQ